MREYVPCTQCVYASKACPDPHRRIYMQNGYGCTSGLLKEKALRRLQLVLDRHMMWKRMTGR